MKNIVSTSINLPPRDRMPEHVKKWRDFYALKPDAPILMVEFGYYSADRWIREGYIKHLGELQQYCCFDQWGKHSLGNLGWCEAALNPAFEEKVLEDRGEYELVRDYAGRSVLYFKGRRNGFMPEYVDHPVKDMQSWERDVTWRLDKNTPSRLSACEKSGQDAVGPAEQGYIICQNLIGGYMYLRSLLGPVETLYAFYDQPELIHACMEKWLELSDAVTAVHQKYVTLDEVFLAEDICYNTGCLISPELFNEFLLPYYQQYITNVRKRQLDHSRRLYIKIDTDGYINPVIPLYQQIGADYFSPFEVAANCDVVRTGKQYPEILIDGGMDKRVLSQGRDAIDRMVDSILPVMKRRGGYYPTCDHGVPEEVSFENFIHFRKRLLEFAK